MLRSDFFFLLGILLAVSVAASYMAWDLRRCHRGMILIDEYQAQQMELEDQLYAEQEEIRVWKKEAAEKESAYAVSKA